jgi:hypothetical protein
MIVVGDFNVNFSLDLKDTSLGALGLPRGCSSHSIGQFLSFCEGESLSLTQTIKPVCKKVRSCQPIKRTQVSASDHSLLLCKFKIELWDILNLQRKFQRRPVTAKAAKDAELPHRRRKASLKSKICRLDLSYANRPEVAAKFKSELEERLDSAPAN